MSIMFLSGTLSNETFSIFIKNQLFKSIYI